jgi:nucleoside-diphosphate-sugar epimerase
VSKTLAEKAAWEFAGRNGMDVVAIHPATCLGPLLQPALNASCAVLQQLLQGSRDTQEYHWLGAVHVRDVARAQVLLFETPTASGRYLCTNGIYQFGDFAATVSRLFPEFPLHRFVLVACLAFSTFLSCDSHLLNALLITGLRNFLEIMDQNIILLELDDQIVNVRIT